MEPMQHTDYGRIARQIQAERGVTLRRAYQIASQQREFDVQEGLSNKELILEALTQVGAHGGVSLKHLNSVMRRMGSTVDDHELAHLVWAQQKQQNVKFDESHVTDGGSALNKIRLTQKGRKAAEARRRRGAVVEQPPAVVEQPFVDQAVADAELDEMEAVFTAKPSDVEEAEELVPVPMLSLAGYPEIRALMERFKAKEAAKGKAAKMVEAASMISDIDPDLAETMMAKASELDGPSLTRLEREVIGLLQEIDDRMVLTPGDEQG